jgi:hypothetical protein
MFVIHVTIQRVVKVNTLDTCQHLNTIYEQIRWKRFQKVPQNTRVIVVRNTNTRRHYGITSRSVISLLKTPAIITL